MSLNETDFTYISHILREDSAIVLEMGKQYLVESRLTPLIREEGIPSIEDLVFRLRQSGQWNLRRRVVEALTTNETSFFRDLDPFESLRKTILPELIKKCEASRKLTIWSAACSTGQEVYSIAMLIREHFPQLLGWDLHIHATDLAREVMQKAQQATYNQTEVNRGLPMAMLVKYFSKSGTQWVLKDDVKRMVTFSEQNLIDPVWKVPQCDLLFMRNVLIYFSLETKQRILAKVRATLSPHGFLFLGAAETTLNIDDSFGRRALEKGSCYFVAKG